MTEINVAHYGKWLEAISPLLAGLDVKFTNMCAVCCEISRNQVFGFSVFEPRDLDGALMERVAKRQARPENAGRKFVLYVPLFLKFRAEMVAGEHKIEIRTTSFLHIRKLDDCFRIRDRIRVVNVDDSSVLLKFLKHSMEQLGCVDVVEQISDPLKAVTSILKTNPDVVTMDIQMPGKTGVDVVRELLDIRYFPVIMISSVTIEEGSMVFSALNVGAFDYIQKPKLEEAKAFGDELMTRMLIAVEAKQAVARARLQRAASPPSTLQYDDKLLWCLGASTGGTQALTHFFTGLPTHIPPTLVVQHIPPIFSRAFAESVNHLVPFTVKEAEDNEPVLPDHVYIAPGGVQMGIQMKMGKLHIRLSEDDPVNRFKPSVDYLFFDVATLRDRRIVAAVLTGMGKDGAEGMLRLKTIGSFNIAQDEKSSAVYGMPRAAVEVGATHAVLPLDEIPSAFIEASERKQRAG